MEQGAWSPGSLLPAPRSPLYPVRCLGEDRRTQGNWGGVHGRDGYVLPDYDGAGKDVRKLPSLCQLRNFESLRTSGVGGRG